MIIKRKLRLAFLAFTALTLGTVSSGYFYFQSKTFAATLKRLISEKSPKTLGIVGDFESLNVYLFPPGLGVVNPRVSIQKNNIADLPVEGTVEAREVRIDFETVQMLSGTLNVQNVKVSDGSIKVNIRDEAFKPQPKKSKGPLKFGWRDLFQLRVEGFTLERIALETQLGSRMGSVQATVEELKLFKDEIQDRPVFVSTASLKSLKLDISESIAKLPIKEAFQVKWDWVASSTGVLLKPLTADVPGMELSLSGEIKGNVLEESSPLSAELSFKATSELAKFTQSFLQKKGIEGEVVASGVLRGNVRNFEKSLKAEFNLNAKDFRYENVLAERAFVSGELDLQEQILALKKATVFSPESSSVHKGRLAGGEIEIGETKIGLALRTPIKTTVKFKNADFHWLGGIVLPDIYLLDGKITGQVEAQYTPPSKPGKKDWVLGLSPDLQVGRFALTNEKWKTPRKHLDIIKPIHSVGVRGPVRIQEDGAYIDGVNVYMKNTKLNVNGSVTGDGIKIIGSGPLDATELDQIAENKIRGSGNVRVNVHGPLDSVLVNIDADLKGAEYLGLRFGDFRGKIIYDDGLSELRFENATVKQGQTFYSLEKGRIDLGEVEDLNLPIRINSGRVKDLAFVLERFIKNLDWYPETLDGEVHGDVIVRGHLDLARLVIAGHVEGSDWSWLGERAKKLKMKLGYEKGIYYADSVEVTKTTGKILGKIQFNENNQKMDWNFLTQALSLYDLDWADRLEVPAKSKIQIQSSGSGTLDQVQSKTEVSFTETMIKGQKLEPTSMSLVVGDKTLRMNLAVFGNKLVSQLKYAITPKQPSSFSLDCNRFDFSPLLLVLNPRLVDDRELLAIIDGKIDLEFLSTQSELARGNIQVNELKLSKKNFKMHMAKPLQMPMQFGYFKINPTEFDFGKTKMLIQGEGNRGEVDLAAKGGVDLALAEMFSSSIQKIDGIAQANFKANGPIKSIKVLGDLKLNGGSVVLRFIQTPFEEIEGVIRVKDGVILAEGIEAYLADELFSMNGSVETFTDRFPILNLKAMFQNNKVKLDPLDLVQAKGLVTISGEQPPYVIGGNVEVARAHYFKPLSEKAGSTARGERFAPKLNADQKASGWFELNMNVNAPQGFLVRNEIMDAEFKGRVKLVGPPQDPKILGEGSLVGGKILFRDRPFSFDSAKIEFDDPNQLNPKFNATATAELGQYKVRVLAQGRATDWKAEFSSTPFLPENDIYSLLTSGQTTSEGGRFRVRDRTIVNQGEAASLILHSLDVSKDMQKKTGFQFDVEEAVDQQSATSIFRPQTPSDNVAAPKLVIKRKVGRKFDLSFGSTVGVGTQVVREVNAEYKVTPSVSVLGVWNAIEGVNTRDSRTSYGLDVKVNKKFK